MLEQKINDVANWCLKKGISVIPIGQSKQPAIKWKELIENPLPSWEYNNCNVAILTGLKNGIVVVDCDSKESYKAWLKHRPPTPLRVRSKRGMHFYYRHPGGYIKSNSHIEAKEGFEYDVKGDRSYAILPPSMIDGHQYQFCVCTGNLDGDFIHPSKLPRFDPAWRPQTPSGKTEWETQQIKDVRKYISTIHAVEGQGGDKDTFRVCAKIAENLHGTEAMAVLADWNQTNCTPPWSIPDLLRKLECAQNHVR